MKLYSKNHFYNLIGYSESFVLNLIENIEDYYYEFEELKFNEDKTPKIKNGVLQKRFYNPSIKELKDIQNKIQSKILSKIDLSPNVLGGIKGNSNVINGRIHKGKKFFFQTDLTNFFPSVSQKMVFNSLRKKNISKQVANIITPLVTLQTKDSWNKKSLPQGAPTSPMISNIVFENIDIKILELIKDKNIYYTRWLDDLTFSSIKDFRYLHNDILSTIGKNGLKVSRKKTTYKVGKTVITGTVVTQNTVKVTQKFRKKESNKLTKNQRQGLQGYKNHVFKINKDKSINTTIYTHSY